MLSTQCCYAHSSVAHVELQEATDFHGFMKGTRWCNFFSLSFLNTVAVNFPEKNLSSLLCFPSVSPPSLLCSFYITFSKSCKDLMMLSSYQKINKLKKQRETQTSVNYLIRLSIGGCQVNTNHGISGKQLAIL